ncbi:Protein-lysine N-methyltransferase efm4 [Polyrhizophydium stewartii]|uniref:Protein-lysine N-methyltransferase EFM4 n=1 Tax=Polyrhizophydium stewartii TaxID=2732419 RepID=A0ABR4NGG5_9FUNG|nr:Methyltransferase-like protein 10 [Polyrhizophydium stewartii]
MDTELNPSKLGTKAHWDHVYEVEVDNFDDHGDKGEVWFGEDSVEKIVDWVVDTWDDKTSPVVDLGCGNGHLLFELDNLGFTDLVGVDYSEKAVELARRIAEDQGTQHPVAFERLDLLDPADLRGMGERALADAEPRRRQSHVGVYALALDKGTFDAISLGVPVAVPGGGDAGSAPAATMSPADLYVDAVAEMLAPGGTLLLTSCNWTEPEILRRFERRFEFAGRVKHPVFTFGGVTGQTITTVALKKRAA